MHPTFFHLLCAKYTGLQSRETSLELAATLRRQDKRWRPAFWGGERRRGFMRLGKGQGSLARDLR